MSIRDMDYFWSGNRHSATIYGNRGVNGIDSTVSTATLASLQMAFLPYCLRGT